MLVSCKLKSYTMQIWMNSLIFCFRLDDIEDNSVLRRGVPVAHSIYGVGSTINAANYVMFIALENCIALGDPEVSSYITKKSFSIQEC